MRDSSIYFKMLEILVFDVLEPRDEGSSDYSSMYFKALSAYRNHTRLSNYKTETKEDLLDLLNELMLDSKVEFLDANTTWDYDENGNRLSWIYQNIKKRCIL